MKNMEKGECMQSWQLVVTTCPSCLKLGSKSDKLSSWLSLDIEWARIGCRKRLTSSATSLALLSWTAYSLTDTSCKKPHSIKDKKNKKECRSWNIITKKESWNYGLERKLHTLQKNLCALWWSGWTRRDRMVTLVPLPRSRTCCSRPGQKKKRKAAHSSTRERKCWKFIGLTHVIQHGFQGDASIAWRLQWC